MVPVRKDGRYNTTIQRDCWTRKDIGREPDRENRAKDAGQTQAAFFQGRFGLCQRGGPLFPQVDGWMYFCSVLQAARGSPRARLLHQGGPTGAGKCGDCFTLGPGPIMWLDDAAKRSPCESASLGCLHEQPDRSMISIMLNRLTCGMALPRLQAPLHYTIFSPLSLDAPGDLTCFTQYWCDSRHFPLATHLIYFILYSVLRTLYGVLAPAGFRWENATMAGLLGGDRFLDPEWTLDRGGPILSCCGS